MVKYDAAALIDSIGAFRRTSSSHLPGAPFPPHHLGQEHRVDVGVVLEGVQHPCHLPIATLPPTLDRNTVLMLGSFLKACSTHATSHLPPSPHLGQEHCVDVGVVLEGVQHARALRMAGGAVDEGLVHALRVFAQGPDVVAAEGGGQTEDRGGFHRVRVRIKF